MELRPVSMFLVISHTQNLSVLLDHTSAVPTTIHPMAMEQTMTTNLTVSLTIIEQNVRHIYKRIKHEYRTPLLTIKN